MEIRICPEGTLPVRPVLLLNRHQCIINQAGGILILELRVGRVVGRDRHRPQEHGLRQNQAEPFSAVQGDKYIHTLKKGIDFLLWPEALNEIDLVSGQLA